jgi:glycosyltransferase involved in cell wall biosynthesis
MGDVTPFSASLGSSEHVSPILELWREHGLDAAKYEAAKRLRNECSHSLLEQELLLRLDGAPGPRLLIDGVWFSRPFGGITRVWEQILSTWRLPGLNTHDAPIAFIDRNSHLALCAAFRSLDGADADPLDVEAVKSLSDENAALASSWSADVFLSSWISHCDQSKYACPELALVHDCLPERYGVAQPLADLRRRWLQGATAHLSVSRDTADDLVRYLKTPKDLLPWCHPVPAPVFAQTATDEASARLWEQLRVSAGFQDLFILLPATSSIGSYKNPELVANALRVPPLQTVQLVVCGVGSQQRSLQLQQHFPWMAGRCLSVGLTDLELAVAYRYALAVVIPSHAEGFGLPAVEAMAAGAVVLVADSRGLREAGGNAAMRFDPRQPTELASLLQLLLESNSNWLRSILLGRAQRRLAALQPDGLGLALLALARRLVR